ncbi:Protein AGENET DOMAIN (AGD)-CONTAINING P1 [Linum perenne]
MDVDSVKFVEWEEHIICHEKGSRVVHYYLKNALGESVLAVIGTERSIRHMIYAISNGFLELYGSSLSVNAAAKWRARREVVDWLTSMVSKESGGVRNGSGINGYNNDLRSIEAVTGLAPFNTYFPEHVAQRKLMVRKASIAWSGVALICAKQLKHYPSFTRNGTMIPVHSFVFVLAAEVEHYLGYLEDIYEDKKGKKKAKVRWFYLSEELNSLIPQLNPHPREVVITPHVQIISAECIDSSTTVLTPLHFEKYVAVVQPNSSSSAVHMCFRQIKNNKLKPFALTKLNGYSNQSIVASLAKQNGECSDLNKLTHDVPVRVDGKRKRTTKAQQGSQIGYSPTNVATDQPSTFPKLKFSLSRSIASGDFVAPRIPSPVTFKVGEKIEFLCEDSGIRGCWFRCKVLETSKSRLKVQYIDVQDVETSCNLEEWVPATRSAAPDKLGIRCAGRQRVRPFPPKDLGKSTFEVGAPVDAWWCDGWWEGVVSAAGKECLQVYLPGESKSLNVPQKQVRTSRDWIQNRWVDLNPKADILNYLSSNIGCNGKLKTPVRGDARNSEQKVVPVSSEQKEILPSLAVSKEMLNLVIADPSEEQAGNEKNHEMNGNKFVHVGEWSQNLNMHQKSETVQVLSSAAGALSVSRR